MGADPPEQPGLEPVDGTVLVVDDDEAVRRFFVRALRRAGLATVEAADGQEGLEAVARDLPSVVLLDSHMPGLTGLEMLRELRRETRTATLPVILVTGQADIDDRVGGLEAGANDYVTKPVHPEELVARVRAQLRGQGAWRAAMERRWEERASIVDALTAIPLDGSAEDIGELVCRELAARSRSDSAAIFVVTGDEQVAPLAGAGFPGPFTSAGRALADGLGQTLRGRAPEGAFTYRASGMGPLIDGTPLACAPLRIRGKLLGLLVLGTTTPAEPGALAGNTLATAIDLAPVVAALLAPALEHHGSLAGPRHVIQRVVVERSFGTVFQPVVSFEDWQTVGFEALTRFSDGVRPEIRFAEAGRLGIGPELEQATIEHALAEATRLPEGLFVSLNVSSTLLVTSDLVNDLLSAHDRPLVLELTEQERVEDYEALRRALQRLKPGTRLAVDDAGAGYASLRHILALHPAFIKLDASWVRDLDHDSARQALVAGLGYFASYTGCQLVAEGIETEREMAALRDLGVQLGQGYLFSMPLPAEELARS
ncbi:MAG: EAL domain-containing protein [Acidimicrobiia bacterium]|nr:EAL domain-containing protein [Acidimicrobiia bacterium]